MTRLIDTKINEGWKLTRLFTDQFKASREEVCRYKPAGLVLIS